MSLIEDKSIADDREEEQVLKGIQPRRQKCYKFFIFARLIGILGLVLAIIGFIATRFSQLNVLTGTKFYRYGIFYIGVISLGSLILAILDKTLFLKKAPFDDWVFEIAEKTLGTDIIFYDGRYIYINYDRHGKEVDKRDFVSEMSDKSIHYSYFYLSTDIDQGYIKVECKKRQPIPDRASFKPEDDKFWNIIPMGLTINPNTQKISPIGWYMNDNNKNDELYPTVPSVSLLIAGGTGCYIENTPILMYDTIVH